jgi:hypothetical protein
MYKRIPSLVLAFHGCDRSVGERILGSSTEHLQCSLNSYDWLGNGIYFWEASPLRAYQFALEARENPRISKGRIRHPFVVGAVVNLGHCLSLLDASALNEMKAAHEWLKLRSERASREMPTNRFKDHAGSFLLRDLDCAVIEAAHFIRHDKGKEPYDSVRAALWEGGALYEGAGVTAKSHVQLCVRNPLNILGYFRVRDIDGFKVSNWDRLSKSAYSHFHGSGACLGPAGIVRSSGLATRRRTLERRAESVRVAAAGRGPTRSVARDHAVDCNAYRGREPCSDLEEARWT